MVDSKSKETDSELEAALENTFPASDPISLDNAGNDRARIDRRPAQIDRDLVERLARQARQKSGPVTRH